MQWKQVLGIGFLAGIGFTMSIFITLLAFDQAELITESKISILLASLVSGAIGFVWLAWSLRSRKPGMKRLKKIY
jgi:NhaA family Na+:H+ antiporter